MMRHLLYHRGIDDGYVTYVTDYVIGLLFVIFAICLGAMSIKVNMLRKKEQRQKSKKNNKKQVGDNRRDSLNVFMDFSVIEKDFSKSQDNISSNPNHSTNLFYLKLTLSFMFFSCGAMHLLGGLTHMGVQYAPMTSLSSDVVHDDLLYTKTQLERDIVNRRVLFPLYVVWQVANIFGGLVAGFILFSVHLSLTCDFISKPKNCTRSSRAFSNTSARSHSSTVNSTAPLSKPSRNPVSKCVLINFVAFHRLCFKYALNTVAVLMATSNFLYHAWNIYAYNSAIQKRVESVEKMEELLNAGVAVLDRHFSSQDKHLNLDSLWGMDATIPILGLAIFVYAVMATCSVLSHLKETNCKLGAMKEEENKLSVVLETCQEGFENCDSNLPQDQNKQSVNLNAPSFGRFYRKISLLSPFYVKNFRCLGAWLVLSSGVVQFGFSSQCGSDDAYEKGLCPFPDSFNHNSVYHVMLGLGMSFLFVAECFHFCSEIFMLNRQSNKINVDVV